MALIPFLALHGFAGLMPEPELFAPVIYGCTSRKLKSPITAKIEIDVLVKGIAKRKAVTVRQYENSMVDIYCEPGNEYVNVTANPNILRLSRSIGDVDDLTMAVCQIASDGCLLN